MAREQKEAKRQVYNKPDLEKIFRVRKSTRNCGSFAPFGPDRKRQWCEAM